MKRIVFKLVWLALAVTNSIASAQDLPPGSGVSLAAAPPAPVEIAQNQQELFQGTDADDGLPPAVLPESVPANQQKLFQYTDEDTPSSPGRGLIFPQAASGENQTKYPTVAVTGFAQIDALYFNQDANSIAANSDIQDFAGFRRARLAAKGEVTENVAYFFEIDFAFPGRPSFMDVWVELDTDTPLGIVRIGQFRQPISMDGLTSVRDLVFLDRGSPFAFLPFRQIGVMAYNTAFDERVTWAISGHRFPTDAFGDVYSDTGYGITMRGTAAPVYDSDTNQVLHFGLGYNHNRIGRLSGGGTFPGIRATPEVGYNVGTAGANGFGGPFFANTGPLATANGTNLFNVEFAYAYESFLMQSEFFNMLVNDPAGDHNYTGAYLQMAYVLTGEHHKYNKSGAVFGRVIPNRNLGSCGWGAWEIAGRWSYINLQDTPNAYVPGQPPTGVSPTLMNDLTFGLNWYWNPYAKMQFNYIHSFQDIKGGPNANTNIFGVRTQFDF